MSRACHALLLITLSLWAALVLPQPVKAQGVAALVADNVEIAPGGTKLIASGNVEVFYDGTQLQAEQITFDQVLDRLIITGPIIITRPDGTIFTALSADLDPRLENGILRSARLVLEEQLQLAANQIDRVDGRYTQLSQVAATSCHVCTEGGTPLWEIRARRIVHDDEEKQLYFDDATFHVAGVPVFWLPRLRLPDPSLTRATGFLAPRFTSSNTLSTGLRLPYFIRLGDHRDLTLTPYLSSATTTLEGTYRQAFSFGDLQISGALSQDDIAPDLRSYLFIDGIFDLGHDVILRFDTEYSSDRTYLIDYGYSSKDRLDSEASLTRVRDRDLTEAAITYYSSKRFGEATETLPPLLLDVSWERRVTPDWGGAFTFTSDLQGHWRETTADITGRDVVRFGAGARWTGSHITDYGLVIEGQGALALDYYVFNDDSTAENTLRSAALAATTLRYPMIRQSGGTTHLLEPIFQLAWSNLQGGDIPNEDSSATEFDQANLFALSRFAGEDATESGARAAYALRWTRIGQNGWDSTLTLGQVFRDTADTTFSPSSGLSTRASDWLVAGQLRVPSGLVMDTRMLFNQDYHLSKSETRIGWDGDRLDLEAGHIYLPADLFESRPNDISEWTIDASYQFNDVWSAGIDARFDAISSGLTQSGLQIGWQNECVVVDFSVSRRYTTSTTLSPSTNYGLSVELAGFGTGPSLSQPSHRCTN